MKMKKRLVGISAGLLLLALTIAGCGGGGGGATATGGNSAAPAATYGRMGASINFGSSTPARFAATTTDSNFDYTTYASDSLEFVEDLYLYQGCGDYDLWLDAAINANSGAAVYPAYVYVTGDAEFLFNPWYEYYDDYLGEYVGPLASACTYVVSDSTYPARVSLSTSGSFEIKNVAAGTNHLVEAVVYTGGTGYGVYVAGIVPQVAEGEYSDVSITPASTLVAAAATLYTITNGISLSLMDSGSIDAINGVVNELFPNGINYGESVIPTGFTTPVSFTDFSSFYTESASGSSPWAFYVLEQAGLYDSGSTSTIPTASSPTIVAFYPADGETGWAYDAPYFKVQFDQAMDTSITPTGFSLTILNASTGGMLTIDDTNASSYGTFSWITLTTSNDTLVFQLNSSTSLTANGLKTLQPNVTYTITGFSPPGNLLSADGMAVDLTGAPSTGSFTTAGSSPMILGFVPTDGATGVAYDNTPFKVIFDQTMDAAITPTGFSVTILNSSTSGTLTIDDTNSASYGTWMWESTSVTSDTLVFTLLTNTYLTSNGLKTLQPNTSYTITNFTAPSNLANPSGLPVDTTGAPASGSFTTTGGGI